MQSFDSDGVRIAYIDEGEGEPILLIHGFASNTATNWVDTRWVRTLRDAGRRVIAYDNRGHGQSEKLYEPERYGAPEMAEDAKRLLDYLGIERVDVLDRADSPGGTPPLHAELAAVLYGSGIELRGHVYGLGGRDLHPEDVRAVFAGTATPYVGLRGEPCLA